MTGMRNKTHKHEFQFLKICSVNDQFVITIDSSRPISQPGVV